MADFDLTQTDAQVQSILNDAQDAQGAGAQTTLTTDYIMLKGTNGRYHKIQKDSFTEAVRNVLAGLLVNNDKGTTISQVAAIASGDFGSITPANLASVLGGVVTTLSNSTSLNDCTTPGLYEFRTTNPSMEGVPTDLTLPFIMIVTPFSGASSIRLQRIYTVGIGHAVYIRNYSASQNKWMDWDKFTGETLT